MLDLAIKDSIAHADEHSDAFDVEHAIAHAAHLLPCQGPIEVFVHHNTLHAFEHLPFDEAVAAGLKIHGANPYLPESQYRARLDEGRILVKDVETVLLDDLGDDADYLVASLGTRYALRLAILQFPLRTGDPAELHWIIAETNALRKFRGEVPTAVRRRTIESVKQWMTSRETKPSVSPRTDLSKDTLSDVVSAILPQFNPKPCETWNDRTWEAFSLQFLWEVCKRGALSAETVEWNFKHQSDRNNSAQTESKAIEPNGNGKASTDRNLRFGTFAKQMNGSASDQAVYRDMQEAVNSLLIQFCSTLLDQGFAGWELPERDKGLFHSFQHIYRQPFCSPTPWLAELCRETSRLHELHLSPLKSIQESFELMGIAPSERDAVIEQMLLALPGWAGMIWQMETNAEWAVHPARSGSLTEYLAVRLIVERVAANVFARDLQSVRAITNATGVANRSGTGHSETTIRLQHAFSAFQLAQVRGWNPRDLHFLTPMQWATLIHEIDAFSSLERRRIYHQAYEKKYRDETLNALIAKSRQDKKVRTTDTVADTNQNSQRALFQLVCCIDDREESFRRHMEEVEPRCETFGVAGFYGIAMYYRGVTDAHFRPLCPVSVKPQHYVTEEPTYSVARLSERQAETRRRIGRATHQAHLGSRTVVGGLLTGLFGSLAAFPLVARILFPRTAARVRNVLGRIVRPSATQLRIERLADTPGEQNGHLGYSLDEMANIVESGLRCIGLAKTEQISQLVLICGHGSGSVNNPHESAYNCGACSGGRGGPNARAFSQMANDPRVRERLAVKGLSISEDVHFVGGYHNTCDDSLTWFDLDVMPIRLRSLFEQAQAVVDEARARSARERCRRFASAPLGITSADALAHVEGRAEDLSQARPEYNHATCALCFVGRREWSRSLFLDRRAFLTSYDPTQDGADSPILERLLQAVIPVCAGISLEYYFSTVDNEAYGCGNKLPHNLTSLLGVMTGASSDLRPGLAAQMVEIHEPMRILFVVDSTQEAMQRIIKNNPAIARLVNGEWVQLAVFNPESARTEIYQHGQFLAYEAGSMNLPIVQSSDEWTRGQREHLGFASIRAEGNRV
jgi:uncharacterized protein